MAAPLALWPLILACVAVAGVTCLATWLAAAALRRFQILDRPNARSSHVVAKPRGGGLALLPIVLIAWILALRWLDAVPPGFWPVVTGAACLGVVSWIDDLKSLPALTRFLAQGLAVAFGMVGLAGAGPVFQGLLPPALDLVAAGFLWLWFVNLFNFMDGIDGISGVEAIAIGLGLGLAALLSAGDPAQVALPWLLAAAALGFLVWNWPPARVFLGDVGSVSLGFLLGWLLLLAAAKGAWAVAAILPAYYLADATITLLRRGLRGETVWRAHREHFYQRATQGGWSHGRVSGAVALCNLALIGLALASTRGYPWLALAGAVLAVGLLLFVLARASGARLAE